MLRLFFLQHFPTVAFIFFSFIVGNTYEMASQQKQYSHTECTTVNSNGENGLTFENSLTVSSAEVGDFAVSSNK